MGKTLDWVVQRLFDDPIDPRTEDGARNDSFGPGAAPDGVVATDGQLSPEAAQAARELFQKIHGGLSACTDEREDRSRGRWGAPTADERRRLVELARRTRTLADRIVTDLDPDQTNEERERHGATRVTGVRQGGGAVELTGAPERETR